MRQILSFLGSILIAIFLVPHLSPQSPSISVLDVVHTARHFLCWCHSLCIVVAGSYPTSGHKGYHCVGRPVTGCTYACVFDPGDITVS